MILLDTQVVAWLALEPAMLTKTAREAIRIARTQQGVAISDKTLWELAMMIDRRRIKLAAPMLDFLRATESLATVLPVDAEIAARSMSFSARFPKDPADRIIAATALEYRLPLVTSDRVIHKSGEVPCIW